MKLLIVDDENISRKILAKKLNGLGEVTACDDSKEALSLFDKAHQKKAPYELITLDVSMPKMDGRQLLSMIRKKEKILKIPKEDRVKIIMVTARMNMSTIKECIKLGCNGYVTKPVSRFQLTESLSRMGFEMPNPSEDENRAAMNTIVADIIKQFYSGRIKLPVMPRILQEIRELENDPDAGIAELETLLKNDIAVSARLVSAANSAIYRGIDTADTLNSALVRLGMKTSCNLVTTIAAKALFQSENRDVNTVLERLWIHSFACGIIGKQIAESLEMENADILFLMGIVHDIGKMLLIKAIVDKNPEEIFNSDELQLAIHEIHTTFGAALLKRMKFSKEFIQIAEFHHWNSFAKDDERALVIIHLADFLAKAMGFGTMMFDDAGEKDTPAFEALESFKQLELEKDAILEMMEKSKPIIEQSAKAF